MQDGVRSACVVLVCGLLAAAPASAADEVDAAAKKLMAANGFYARGMYDLAAKEYTEFLGKYPAGARAAEARYGLGVCRYRQGRFAEAAGVVEKALADKGFQQRDEALAVLGHCRLSTGDCAKALTAFDELLAKHRRSPHAEFGSLCRLQALYRLGRYAPASEAARAVMRTYPNGEHRPAVEYYLAMSLAALKRYAEAGKAATTVMIKYPGSPYALDARLLLGQCLEDEGKLDAAARQYRSAIKLAPPERKVQGQYSLALVLYRSGQHAEAIQEFSAVLKASPSGKYAAAARLQLGLAQVAAGKIADARKTLAEVVAKDPSRAAEARYGLAQCDMAEGKYDAARATLEALAKANPPPANLAAIVYDRAVCTAEVGKYAEAVNEFEAFRKTYPQSELTGEATYRQAYALHRLSRYAESLALCKLVTGAKVGALARPVAELASENQFLTGQYKESAPLFAELSKTAKDPRDKLRFKLRQAECVYFGGDVAASIPLLKKLAGDKKAAKDAVLREAVFLLGDAWLQTKKYKEAGETLKKYLSGGGGRKDEAKYKLALAQLRGGQTPAAKKLFAELTSGPASSPWVIRATFEHGQLAYRENRPADAAAALTKVLAAKPPEDLAAAATYLLAWIDQDAGRHDPAAGRFGEVVAKYPKHALAEQAAFQQGVCLNRAGKHDAAAAALGAYLKAHPTGRHALDARRLVGTCLAATGKHDEAAKVLAELAAKKDTSSDAVLYELAWAQRQLRRTEDAKQTYRRLLAEYGKSKLVPNARAELAELLDIEKQYAEAAALLQQVLADPAADAKTVAVSAYRLGLCQVRLNKHAEAAAAFDTFVKKFKADENVPSALYQAGAAWAVLGKHAEARTRLAELLGKYSGDALAPAARLKLGEVEASAGQYAMSAAVYAEYLKKHPRDRYAYLAKFGMGWALENQGKKAEAIGWYQQVVETHNGATAARAQFQIGECHYALGKYDLAAKELMKVDIVYAYPQWSAVALYDAGRAFEQLKQVDNARKQYALCVKKYKGSAPAALAAKRLAALGGAKP